jgi:hypothetical protein
MFRRTKVIRLDNQTRRIIVELLAVRTLLLQHRNARLGRIATILYGLTIGAGYVFVMGIIKAGWFEFAPLLFVVVVGCWLVASWLSNVEKQKPIKIRIAR